MTNRSKRHRKASSKAVHKPGHPTPVAQPPGDAEWFPASADAQLLDDARTQWQLGDWQALARIPVKAIEAHPGRASIALLVAAAHQQLDQLDTTRELAGLARQWGASKEQVVRVLTAGVHNVLARVTALSNQEDRSLEHFRQAVSLGGGSTPSDYLVQARASAELRDHVAASPAARNMLAASGNHLPLSRNEPPSEDDALCRGAETDWCQGNWLALCKLDNAGLPNDPNRITLGIYAACGHQQVDDGEAEQRCVQALLAWGAEKARIKRFLLSGIYNRLGKANAYAGDYAESARYFHKAFDHVLGDLPQAKQYLEQRVKNQLSDLPQEEVQAIITKF